MSFLKFDPTNLFIDVTKKDLAELKNKLQSADKKLKELRVSKEQGFFALPFAETNRRFIEAKAKMVQKKFKRLIVIGIGGSDLGARAIHQALPSKKMELVFLSNPDPDTIAKDLGFSAEEWKITAINLVSKSGTTLEPLAIFFIARARMIKALGVIEQAKHIFVTTETKSPLATWAEKQKYEILPHPQNVGGRFAVLSIVGLFPAACGGVDIKRLLAGAQSVDYAEAAKFAALQYLNYQKGRTINVLMPYSDRLSRLPFWFRQLWAESLGKDGFGPTPIAALGAVDQHSQIQLYNDGPNNKTVTFIEVEKFSSSLRVSKSLPDLEYVVDKDLADLLHAERKGTAMALTKNKKPNATIFIPNISPEALGALFQFFMVATAYAGELFGINTYNQPGVEAGKKETRKVLEEGVKGR
ncbi:MAG: glucose-6-phosphate isomerase [Candidatus Uhrbacteria bacterium]